MPRTSGANPGSLTARRLLVGAIVLVPFVILAVGAWQYRWMSDDGFINLRIISELKAGHGPVFNAGERVEASTSPLWILVLLVGDLVLPLRLEWVAVLLGIGLTLVGIGLAVLGATRLSPGTGGARIWVPAGALVLAVLAPMWKFASSGFENGLTFAWLGACLAILATWVRDDGNLRPWGAVVLGLGALVRPELALLSLAFVAVAVGGQWKRNRWPTRLALVGWALALPAAYEIFRMGFYASLAPNSAFAKEAARSYTAAGWTYLREAVEPYELWIPILVLLAAAYIPLLVSLRNTGRTRGILVVAAFAIGAIADTAYIVRVGGTSCPRACCSPRSSGSLPAAGTGHGSTVTASTSSTVGSRPSRARTTPQSRRTASASARTRSGPTRTCSTCSARGTRSPRTWSSAIAERSHTRSPCPSRGSRLASSPRGPSSRRRISSCPCSSSRAHSIIPARRTSTHGSRTRGSRCSAAGCAISSQRTRAISTRADFSPTWAAP